MKSKGGETSQLVDQLAKTAHEVVDRMHERAAEMEQSISKQSQETGKQVVAGLEREVSSLETYIEENPMMAAVVAFGIGAFASRLMKATAMAPPKAASAESASSGAKKKASISKAA